MTDVFDADEIYERAVEIDRLWDIQDDLDLAHVLKDRAGRNTIWRILSICGIYDGIPTDQDVLRNLGKRDIGLALQHWVFTSDESAYSIMKSEADKRERERKERLNG